MYALVATLTPTPRAIKKTNQTDPKVKSKVTMKT